MRRAERSLSSGSSAAQPSSTLDRSTPALAHTKPCLVSLMMRSPRRRTMRTDSRLDDAPCGRAGRRGRSAPCAPSAFDTTFWVTTTTSPSRRSGLGRRDQAGQVVAGAAPRGCRRSGSTSRRHHASTTSASARGLVGAAHDRRRHHAAHALGLDRGRVVGVGLVDHERGRERRVEAGDADHRRLVAELAQQPVGRALQRGAGDDRRDGDDVVAAGRDRVAHAGHGEHRVDRHDRVRRGDHDHARPSAMASSTPGRRAGGVGAVEADGRRRRRRGGAARSTPGSRSRPRRPP